MEAEDRRFIRLKGDLRQLVAKLDEASLRLVHHWVDHELRVVHEHLRVVQNPSAFDLEIPADDPIAMLGVVRRLLHELPEDRLLQLYGWIERRLQNPR